MGLRQLRLQQKPILFVDVFYSRSLDAKVIRKPAKPNQAEAPD